jgi:hypothetical protein
MVPTDSILEIVRENSYEPGPRCAKLAGSLLPPVRVTEKEKWETRWTRSEVNEPKRNSVTSSTQRIAKEKFL